MVDLLDDVEGKYAFVVLLMDTADDEGPTVVTTFDQKTDTADVLRRFADKLEEVDA